MCGMPLWRHGSWWYMLQQSGQLVRLWRGTDVAQEQKLYTQEAIHPTCLLSIGADTRQVCLFLQTDALPWVCVLPFFLLLNVYFRCHVLQGRLSQWDSVCDCFLSCASTLAPFLLMIFLLPLFKPCLTLKGVQCSGLGKGNLFNYI